MSFKAANKSPQWGSATLVYAGACLLLCSLAIPAHARQVPASQFQSSAVPGQSEAASKLNEQQTPEQSATPRAGTQNRQTTASITGKVVDQSGVSISGAKVKLSRDNPSIAQEILTDEGGQFSFANLPAGPFHLTISSPNLTPQTFDDVLQPGQTYALPLVMLTVATQVTEVHVTLPPDQLAELQVKDLEKQRVFGFIPNFYVSYIPNPAPLTRKLKFQLALKSSTDPVTLGGIAVLAGVEQASNKWKEYGQGAQGYFKRFGASYADVASGTFIGNAVLPVVFKQDPRYFYEGPSHPARSRIIRALAGAFIAKSDRTGNWEPNYSDIIGSMAAGGISNLYYPSNRRGMGLVFSTAAIRLGEITAANFFEEFLSPKFTPNLPAQNPSQPDSQP
jgi:Carboxypeptidase regulatory-like domain